MVIPTSTSPGSLLPIFVCLRNTNHNWTPNATDVRCFYDQTSHQLTPPCTDLLVNFGSSEEFENYRTLCHPEENPQERLQHVIGILTSSIFVGSLMSLFVIQPYLDPITRLKVGNSWNGFYKTKSIHALKLLRGKDISSRFLGRVFLSAIQDNIDSLVYKIMEKYQERISANKSLLRAALSMDIVNDEIRGKLESQLSDCQEGAQLSRCVSSGQPEEGSMEVLPLNLQQVKISISIMKKNLKRQSLSTESTLQELIETGDKDTIKHFLIYHGHLCSQLLALHQAGVKVFPNQAMSAMEEALESVEQDGPTLPTSETSRIIRIQLNHHLQMYQETFEAFDLDNETEGQEQEQERDIHSVNVADDDHMNDQLEEVQEKLQRLHLAPGFQMVVLLSGLCILAWLTFIIFLLATGNTFGTSLSMIFLHV